MLNDVELDLAKRDFDFYYHLLHKTRVVNNKFRNFTNAYILCSAFNSLAFEINYVKIQFHFYQILI